MPIKSDTKRTMSFTDWVIRPAGNVRRTNPGLRY
jgi:hypothetical protein